MIPDLQVKVSLEQILNPEMLLVICVNESTATWWSYLIEGKRPHAVRSQLQCVQHGHLNHPVRLRASTGPILVTFHLQTETKDYLALQPVVLEVE